ncbi:ATP-binding protein [Phocaeicola coprophilus]|uniref:ATP-binding protein n=1 Tax=Phocaeicola coprophilus TaxID=387090 RepID=UPI0039942332
MNTQETVIQLKELKLKGMANTLESLMTLPVQSRPSFDFAIAKMVEAEILERKERKTEMFLKTAYSGGYPFSISGDIRSVPS